MTPEEMREKAIQLFINRSDSSEARPLLRSGKRNWGKKIGKSVRAMGAFAGGLGANGEVCGALVGALAVVGLRFGRNREDEKEDPKMWSYTRELTETLPRRDCPEPRRHSLPGNCWSRLEEPRTSPKFLQWGKVFGVCAHRW